MHAQYDSRLRFLDVRNSIEPFFVKLILLCDFGKIQTTNCIQTDLQTSHTFRRMDEKSQKKFLE